MYIYILGIYSYCSRLGTYILVLDIIKGVKKVRSAMKLCSFFLVCMCLMT